MRSRLTSCSIFSVIGPINNGVADDAPGGRRVVASRENSRPMRKRSGHVSGQFCRRVSMSDLIGLRPTGVYAA